MLIQIQVHFTLITFNITSENRIPAFRTDIAGLFVLNPFFSSVFSSIMRFAIVHQKRNTMIILLDSSTASLYIALYIKCYIKYRW